VFEATNLYLQRYLKEGSYGTPMGDWGILSNVLIQVFKFPSHIPQSNDRMVEIHRDFRIVLSIIHFLIFEFLLKSPIKESVKSP